ncbi:hypothetical protein LZ31DRAFT_590571 [Colletotrichum somersetense]|nr:hypothetical protein LZ31DRAFT_590571 [Colletotrichum somersetense]
MSTQKALLLEKGADISAWGGPYGNALMAASERGHDDTVHMLLDMMSLSDSSLNDSRLEKDNALVLHYDTHGGGILEAGTSSGVLEGNVYALVPLGTDRLTSETVIGTATVTHCGRLRSRAKVDRLSKKIRIPAGVRAFLNEEVLRKLPVSCPGGLGELRDAIDESKYLFRKRVKRGSGLLAKFQKYGDDLVLVNGQGVQLASRYISDEDSSSLAVVLSKDLVERAEQLARAQHLLALTCADGSDEKLEHSLSVTFGTVKNSQHDRVVTQDGNGYVIEGERVFVSLTNNGSKNIYASVFDINVVGKISLISSSHARGIEMPPQRSYVLGADQSGLGLEGLPVSWPSGVQKSQAVPESLFLILTDSPVDLRQLTEATHTNYRGHVGSSSLERLACTIATGARRDIDSDIKRGHVCFDTLHIPFRLTPFEGGDGFPGGEERELRIEDVPLLEEVILHQDIPLRSPYLEHGALGTVNDMDTSRGTQAAPACIWVVNEHDEDILVVVSKYRRPNRTFSSDVDISMTDAGIDLGSNSFLSPACKKTLTARSEGKDTSIIRFPLWPRKEGFGVISIFKGPDKEPYIENDQIPLGATVFFSNRPDLRIVEYEGRELS